MARAATLLWIVPGLLTLLASPSQGQIDGLNRPPVNVGRFHGTWFNARFIAALNEERSFERAMGVLNPFDPLWVNVDSTRLTRSVYLGYAPEKLDTMQLDIRDVKGAGRTWVMGRVEQPTWIVTDDERKRSYIALTPIDSLNVQPLVLGALPSKNSDPMFILGRMVNNSLVVGEWKAADGKKYRFTNDMVMTVNAVTSRYKLQFDHDGRTVRIITTDGQPATWTIDRAAGKLTLRPRKGAPIVLTRVS